VLATFLVWRLRTGACGFWRYRMPPGILVTFKVGLCSALSFKRSRRELSIHVAEHRSMSKNYEYYPRCSFITKTGIAPKRGFVFTVLRSTHYIPPLPPLAE